MTYSRLGYVYHRIFVPFYPYDRPAALKILCSIGNRFLHGLYEVFETFEAARPFEK